MDKRELDIVVESAKDLPVQTVASTDAKVYGTIRLVVNGSEESLWETSGAEDVMNPKWNKRIKVVLDEGAIQQDSTNLLIHVCVKKENATHDEELGWLRLPLRSFLSHVGMPVVSDYPLEPIQGSLTLKLGVKLLDELIPDVSMAATQPPVMSMRANLPTPYLHYPLPANTVVGHMIPDNSGIAPFYNPPSLPSPPLYPPRPSFYERLSIVQLPLQLIEIGHSLQNLFMSTLGDGGDGGAGSFQDFVMSTLGDGGAGSFQDFVMSALGDWGAGSM